ncbi:MAG: hypothetical protein H0U54_18780 [Acidobacteria bacterium]|nr:hypothetical protein [Acidobacteriota bacterium]
MWCQYTKRLLVLFSGLVVASLLVPVNICAQEATQDSAGEARKFDEFTRVGGCDHSARLDNFAIQLMNEPDTVGYVVAYGPQGDGSGTGNFRLRMSKDYLVNSRGIDPNRIKTIYGGPYKDLEESASELWIASPEAAAPETIKYENKAGEFTGKFIEHPAWDGLSLGVEESTGPPVGDTSTANFADMLRLQPKTYAYIVVYEGDESAPGAWGRVSARAAKGLQSDYGIQSDRIKIIFGGYDKKAKLQLWILPNDAPPPVEEVKTERRLKKNIRLGTFSQYELKYNDGARSVFKEFAEILRRDENLRACIIVRPEIASVPEPGADEADEAIASEAVISDEAVVSDKLPNEVVPDEPPDVDLLQVVEKWKRDLVKEYQISENRMVVMIAPAQEEYQEGHIETWVVPPDAPLPDLYPPQEVETGETEEESPQSLEESPPGL